jgi:hypothetical protein
MEGCHGAGKRRPTPPPGAARRRSAHVGGVGQHQVLAGKGERGVEGREGCTACAALSALPSAPASPAGSSPSPLHRPAHPSPFSRLAPPPPPAQPFTNPHLRVRKALQSALPRGPRGGAQALPLRRPRAAAQARAAAARAVRREGGGRGLVGGCGQIGVGAGKGGERAGTRAGGGRGRLFHQAAGFVQLRHVRERHGLCVAARKACAQVRGVEGSGWAGTSQEGAARAAVRAEASRAG